MKPLARRLKELESAAPPATSSVADADRALDERWAREGTSREQIIAQHGSVGAWAYSEMTKGARQRPAPEPNDGLTPSERYMQLIGKGTPAR